MLFMEKPTINNLNDAFDYGCIQSMSRHMPNQVWDEAAFYRVRFSDGTQRDFTDAGELIRFINYWLDFIFDKED